MEKQKDDFQKLLEQESQQPKFWPAREDSAAPMRIGFEIDMLKYYQQVMQEGHWDEAMFANLESIGELLLEGLNDEWCKYTLGRIDQDLPLEHAYELQEAFQYHPSLVDPSSIRHWIVFADEPTQPRRALGHLLHFSQTQELPLVDSELTRSFERYAWFDKFLEDHHPSLNRLED